MATCAVLSLGAIGAGVGAKIYDGVHVWLAGGKATSVVRSGILLRKPMAADLRSAIARATFPVVFPVGVPAGSRVNMVTVAPLERPSMITISYEGAGFQGSFALLDPSVVDAGGARPSDPALPPMRAAEHFRVGGEVVVALTSSVSAAELDRIKAAMTVTSPGESLSMTEAMLPKIMVLGGTVRLGAAERLSPSGRSVLLDEQSVRSVPGLATTSKPMTDWRISYLDSIRYRDGDVYKAVTVQRPAIIAISAGGVRAIDAVLRTANARIDRAACRCEVLFHQPSRTTYWVWTIPMSGPPNATKYAVDAKTFAVTRE